MAGMDSTWGSDYFHRNEIFSSMMKETFEDELFAMNFVYMLSDFGSEGSNYKINTIGSMEVAEMQEGVPLQSNNPDAGQYIFNIDQFIGSKSEFTRTFLEEDFQANEVLAQVPGKMNRALNEYIESAIYRLQREQTANDANAINGRMHRLVASGDGTSAPTNALTVQDFAYAKLALDKAKAPQTNRIAIVSPETEFVLNTNINITDISNNPRWEGIIETGLVTSGYRFIRNIYGFDVYTSDYLDVTTADEAALTTYGGGVVADSTGMIANQFFVAGGTDGPFMGAWGRSPAINSWEDPAIETEYHQLSAKFGFGLYRPESLVTILSNNSIA